MVELGNFYLIVLSNFYLLPSLIFYLFQSVIFHLSASLVSRHDVIPACCAKYYLDAFFVVVIISPLGEHYTDYRLEYVC